MLPVEKLIADELTRTRGAVLYDGWICNSVHYVALIASCCTTATVRQNASYVTSSTPRLILSVFSPIGCVGEDDNGERPETTAFNEEAHLSFMGDIFPFCGQDVDGLLFYA